MNKPASNDAADALQETLAALNESNQAHAAHYGALFILLVNKGIITQQEYDKAHIQAQHVISQMFAKKRDAAEKGEPG